MRPMSLFITLEGGEGAGKSTQARRLAARFRTLGRHVETTREPGGSPGAEVIRSLLVSGDPERWTPQSEAFLLAAARHDHVSRTIMPALDQGAIVICDRFTDSTMAYQGFGHGLDRARVAQINAMATSGLVPNLTLILDVPVNLGLERAESRRSVGQVVNGDRFERMDPAFHDRLREGFLTIAREEPGRCVVIDASSDEDLVEAAIWAAIRERGFDQQGPQRDGGNQTGASSRSTGKPDQGTPTGQAARPAQAMAAPAAAIPVMASHVTHTIPLVARSGHGRFQAGVQSRLQGASHQHGPVSGAPGPAPAWPASHAPDRGASGWPARGVARARTI